MPPASSNPLHVLVIDDEPAIRKLLSEMLRAVAHNVEAAEDGESGIIMFEAAIRDGDPFDAVVTDQEMPGMPGTEVAHIVRKLSPGTPVIMVTGSGRVTPADGTPPEGVDAIFTKPVSVHRLTQALNEAALHACLTSRPHDVPECVNERPA